MPRYRAEIEYTDTDGRERRSVVEVNSPTDDPDDVMQAMREQWPHYMIIGEERLPENIIWEPIEEEEEETSRVWRP